MNRNESKLPKVCGKVMNTQRNNLLVTAFPYNAIFCHLICR